MTSAEETATQVTMTRILPNGARLKVVNVLNSTTPWLKCSAQLCEPTERYTISLFHNIIQVGKKDVHFHGDLLMEDPFRTVRAVINNPVANDVVYLTVGFE